MSENAKISTLLPLRPKPILTELEVLEYAAHIPVEQAVNALLEGHYVLIVDLYASGLSVLDALKKRLFTHAKQQSFQEQRKNRGAYRTISHRLLLEVAQHKLSVRKAPKIGWLKELYPETPDFFLSFPEIQGLNSSWQWYEKGISIPGLSQKIHPYYGTYFPTRFEHISLFDKFLGTYSGEKESAIDVGIGSGVLSYLLQKHGFKSITGTDNNPNALIGIQKRQESLNTETPIKLRSGDLFAQSNQTYNLIVFNPAWIPLGRKTKGIDAAIYYDNELFPRFFDRAEQYLKPNGKIVLIFSNLAQLMDDRFVHPIEHELKTNARFKKLELLKQSVEQQSNKTTREANWREKEMVELWVLGIKN